MAIKKATEAKIGRFLHIAHVHSGMASGGADTAALLAWCVRRGIAVDERLSIEHVPLDAHEDLDLEYQAEGGAMAVVANAPIPAGDTVVYIPCDAVLSTKTSALAHSSEFQEALKLCADNALHLALCLAYERGLEDRSGFAGYVQSLPRRVNLPMCWDASYEGTRWIQGTEAARSVARATQFWDSDAASSKPGYSLVRPLPNAAPPAYLLGDTWKRDRLQHAAGPGRLALLRGCFYLGLEPCFCD